MNVGELKDDESPRSPRPAQTQAGRGNVAREISSEG